RTAWPTCARWSGGRRRRCGGEARSRPVRRRGSPRLAPLPTRGPRAGGRGRAAGGLAACAGPARTTCARRCSRPSRTPSTAGRRRCRLAQPGGGQSKEEAPMHRTSARMNRRELLGLGALALGAAACGGSTGGGGGASSSSQSLSGKKLESTLKFYNWAPYVNPENTKAYAPKTGVNFEEANFTSNEQLLTKLQTTKGQKTYDIIVPD